MATGHRKNSSATEGALASGERTATLGASKTAVALAIWGSIKAEIAITTGKKAISENTTTV